MNIRQPCFYSASGAC